MRLSHHGTLMRCILTRTGEKKRRGPCAVNRQEIQQKQGMIP
jgi:hypothetical protein